MPRLQEWLTRAQQEEQGKADVNSKSFVEDFGKCLNAPKQTLTDQGPRNSHDHKKLYRHPDGSMQASLPTPNPYAEAARWKWSRLVECCQDDKKSVHSTSHDTFEDSPWKEYVEPLSDPLHPFNIWLPKPCQPTLSTRKESVERGVPEAK